MTMATTLGHVISISLTEDPQIQIVILPTMSFDSETPQPKTTELTPEQTDPNPAVTSKVGTLHTVLQKTSSND